MSTQLDDFAVTVYMNRRDVTPWVYSLEVDQGADVAARFRLDFLSWSAVELDAQWDIYGSYQASTSPRDSILLYNGVIPPDQREFVELQAGSVPLYSITGYSYSYLAVRRCPRRTVLVMPTSSAYGAAHARRELERRSDTPIGQVTYWYGYQTMKQAVRRLVRAAGCNVEVNLDDYPIGPFLIGPGETYWSAVKALVDPFQPYVYHNTATNTLHILDSPDSLMGAGNTLTVPSNMVNSMRVKPSRTARPTRVIVRVPAWR